MSGPPYGSKVGRRQGIGAVSAFAFLAGGPRGNQAHPTATARHRFLMAGRRITRTLEC
jgi:hypothetical protein